jgi:hypothetical protein
MATAPGDIYELAITTQESNTLTLIVNVFHFKALTSGCTATSLIVDWRTNIEPDHKICITNGASIVRYVAFNLVPYSTDWAEQRVTQGGSNGSIMLPPLVAAVTTWRTSLPGRRYRGRTYWGPLGSADLNGGRLNQSVTTGRFAVMANKILARYGATGTSTDTRIGVWSRVLGHQLPPHDPVGFTQITGMTVQPNLASMGTRRIGRGV